ncbi:hypothetical protein M427DRAFT_140257 [Gonapodya prolifera JEL478]|uniref:Rhodanese domain-containing protein n=1 Tax=Gonapodya prolifera (strain JEL478) TaxID=1344416 RepID=A0A139A0Q0_GONPJ|nr:hypothetical protein M427DRAFT_140257 [Gonapodya prolifera JEL478]|eukprot:KXS09933.1 hypothetical protein M427DRAFT_140257 [Gonapodya prolifera JEL478]
MSPPLAPRRVAKGESDPVVLPCGGLDRCSETPAWILFERSYLPPHYVYHQFPSNCSPEWLCEDLSRLLAPFPSITGKFRISREGINVTCAGRNHEIKTWLSTWVREDGGSWGEMWTAVGGLEDPASPEHDESEKKWQWTKRRRALFKPMPGCIHAFPNLSIRATEEVTPLAVPKWSRTTLRWNGEPSDSRIPALEPAEWHQLLQTLGGDGGESSEAVLIDARNAYESRAGHFAGATGFDAWPELHHQTTEESGSSEKGATVAMYCTGGVRCEKLSSWVVENLQGVREVFTLNDGIHAYLQWLADQQNTHEEQAATTDTQPDPTSRPIENSNSTPQSLFRGANYVFDARTTLTCCDDCCDMDAKLKLALPLESSTATVQETNEVGSGLKEAREGLCRSSSQGWTSATLVQRRGFVCACERARRAAWDEPITHIRGARE